MHKSTKMIPRKVAAVVFGISVLMGGSPVHAGFLEGQTLSLEIKDTITNPPSTWGPAQFVVNDTVEIGVSNSAPAVSFNLEVTDNTITFTYTETSGFNAASFNGYIFTAISPEIPAFGSITVDPATTLAGFTSADLSLDSTHFYVNVAGLEEQAGTVLKLDVDPDVSSVPEPPSLVLAGLGLLLIGGVSAARRKAQGDSRSDGTRRAAGVEPAQPPGVANSLGAAPFGLRPTLPTPPSGRATRDPDSLEVRPTIAGSAACSPGLTNIPIPATVNSC